MVKNIKMMIIRAYIWIIRLLALLSLGAFIIVLNYTSPDSHGLFGKILFYLTLGVFLSGVLSLILMFIRRKTLGKEMAPVNFRLSLRQGILLGLLSIVLLVFQSFRMLVWWDALMVVAAVFLVELYFLSRN